MTENNPKQKQSFHAGANYDMSPEKIFQNPDTGIYIDAHNMEPNSLDGKTGNITKVKGEIAVFGEEGNYSCVLSTTVRSNLVEFWAPTNPSNPSIVKVNGTIVLSSTQLALSTSKPLRYAVNESVANPEIAISDKTTTPYILNVQDMLDNVNTTKYTTAFNLEDYQVNPKSPLDTMVFIEMVNVGSGGGLAVGMYQYQMRYATKQGDVTQWSYATPMIPVLQSLSSDSEQYPYAKTYGAAPNPEITSAFAPRLRFRVTNLYNYDYIEVKRISYNQGAGKEYTSNGVVVAKIFISPGEISVRDYVDPQESNVSEVVSAESDTTQIAHIDTCGDLRYIDNRLVMSDVQLASKEANLSFVEVNGKQGWPVIDYLGHAGHKDPWAATYRRTEVRGEKAGFAINMFDCVGNSGWAFKITDLKDYEFPNRRDPIATETANYSYRGTVKAATTATGTVGQTHEVFDLSDRTYKSDECSFKNIVQNGGVAGLTGTKTTATVTQDCDETHSQIENHGAKVDTGLVSTAYLPFTPVKQSDTDVTGHNYVVTNKVATDNSATNHNPEGPDVYNYRPAGMAPSYYSLGLMVGGVDNLPNWCRAFSVVRTPSANRVIAQGLGFYSMIQADYNAVGSNSLGQKELNKLWFYSPDIENGMVPTSILNDIIANPSQYQIQMVSPLGFFSEWYGAEDNLISTKRDKIIDMITYARMIRDKEGSLAEINPAENPSMGIDGGDGYRYIDYAKFRNTTSIPTTFSGNPLKGNLPFTLNGATRKKIGRGQYLELETVDNFYGNGGTGGDPNFDDQGCMNFTEPLYVINIIRVGADVNDNDLQKYRQTSHYQKVESIIGKSNGLPNQEFPLVDERWEDCIPAPNSTDYGASTDRYIYVKLIDGTVQKWINVAYKTSVQRASIATGIANGSSGISGMYNHTSVGDRFFNILFDQGYTPAEGALILVRYDNTAPIRVFGGEGFLGEAIFAPLDGQASAIDDADKQFAWGVGLPYRDFKLNPRYYTIRDAGASVNVIQDAEWFSLGFIRQLCVMFTCETRCGLPFAYNGDFPNQFFPLINYVIRPNRWDSKVSIEDNGIFQDYQDDYGAQELNFWKWGGFRFLPQINPDYAVLPPTIYYSKPQFGIDEITDNPTMVMWSLQGTSNVKNAQGIRTFPSNNSYVIDDNTGRIQMLWSERTGNGENLYAITESGTCMLLTQKNVLSDAGANRVGLISVDTFIGGQYWISRDVGVNDKMWRSKVEASIPVLSENGAETLVPTLFFANKTSMFMLNNGQVRNIGAANYYTKLYNEGLSLVGTGVTTPITSVYNHAKRQLWFRIGGTVNKVFVYSLRNAMWTGTFGYSFDKFTSANNKMYGHRNFQTFELGVGYQMSGENIEAWVVTACSPGTDSEFVSVSIATDPVGNKPTEVQFMKQKNGAIQCKLNSTLGPKYLKNYRSWVNFIPCIEASVNVKRPRLQNRMVITKIIHNLAEDFGIVNVEVEHKKIV